MNARKAEAFVRRAAKIDLDMMGWPEKCKALDALVKDAVRLVVNSKVS